MKNENQPFARRRNVGDKAVVYEACFAPQGRATNSVHFTDRQGVHCYIDIDDDSVPLALTLIYKQSAKIIYSDDPLSLKFLKRLEVFAAQIIGHDKQLRQLLRDDRAAQAIPAQMSFRQQLIDNATHDGLRTGRIEQLVGAN